MKTSRKPVSGVVSSTRIGRDLISGTETFSPETLERKSSRILDVGRRKDRAVGRGYSSISLRRQRQSTLLCSPSGEPRACVPLAPGELCTPLTGRRRGSQKVTKRLMGDISCGFSGVRWLHDAGDGTADYALEVAVPWLSGWVDGGWAVDTALGIQTPRALEVMIWEAVR